MCRSQNSAVIKKNPFEISEGARDKQAPADRKRQKRKDRFLFRQSFCRLRSGGKARRQAGAKPRYPRESERLARRSNAELPYIFY